MAAEDCGRGPREWGSPPASNLAADADAVTESRLCFHIWYLQSTSGSKFSQTNCEIDASVRKQHGKKGVE